MKSKVSLQHSFTSLFFTTTLAALAMAPSSSTAAEKNEPVGSSSALEEIIVTGQKRIATTQDIPVTVDVISSEVLRANRVHDLQGLTTVVAGFSYERAPALTTTASIRGIGTAPTSGVLEQSIAPYIDGVYQGGTQRGFAWPLFDLQRVEVFKGTQSGIVGQNTSVGVINIVTQKPGRKFGGYVDASYEFENKGYDLNGAVDVPVSDAFRMRLSGLQQQVGGWVHNFATGHDIAEQFNTAGRINAVWDAAEDVTVSLYTEYDRVKSNGPTVSFVFDDPTGRYATAISPYFNFDSSKAQVAYLDRRGNFGGDDQVKSNNWRGSLTVDWALGGGYSLTSITAASREHDILQVDQDFTPAPPPTSSTSQVSQALSGDSHYKQMTEELRLSSPATDRLSYIVGAWYRHAEREQLNMFFLDRFNANFVASQTYDQEINNAALFGDVQFDLTSHWSVGGSVRHTNETKTSLSSGQSNWPTVFLSYPATRIKLTPSFWDGSARVEYQPADAINLYAGYSHGTKSGAVPDLVGSGILQVLDKEKAATVEIGAKGSLLDRALTYEISAFNMKITGFQDLATQVQNGLTVFVASNSDVETNGVDLSVRVRPVTGLELGMSGEYLDAKNKTFGGPHVRSPKWAAVWDGRYTLGPKIAGGEVSLFGSVQYKDKYRTQPAYVSTVFGPSAIPTVTATESPSFTKLNVGIEYSSSDRYKLTLMCRNCTNEFEYTRVTAASMFGAPVRFGYLNELRTIALDMRYDF